MLITAYIIAALCVPAWLFRGGSLPGTDNLDFPGRRALCLLVPTLTVCAPLFLAACDGWRDAAYLGAAALIFFAAMSPGWFDSTDLGRDADRSYMEEAVILYGRFSLFLLPAIPAAIASYAAAIPFVALALLGPLGWVLEDELFWKRNRAPRFAFVETCIGALLAAATSAAVYIAA